MAHSPSERSDTSFLDADFILPYEAQWMQDLRAARDAFIERGLIEPNVRPFVWQCWRRCQTYRIDPRRPPRQSADPEKLARARAAGGTLLAAAEPVLTVAHTALGEQPHLLVLADREGVILRLFAAPAAERTEGKVPNLFEGASWAERDIGCNGIGTALATNEPTVLIGPEHLADNFLKWSCVGIPLYGPDGAVVGAFGLYVPNDQEHAHAHVHLWGWTLRAAQVIEAALAGTPPNAEALAAVGRLDNPLDGVLGVLELLLRQAGLSSTYARFLEEARRSLNVSLARLQEDQTELLQADEAKDRFLADLGHDLRNPLSALYNALELARHTHTRAQLGQAKALIERQAEQIGRLADDLLDFTRIARGNFVLRKERVDAAECVRQAVEKIRPLMEERRHDLHVFLPEAPLWLDADPARLQQILVNLLANAAKYTPEGGRIALVAAQEGVEAVIQVQDSGIGITPERLARIFEPLGEAGHALNHVQGEGSGLGLGVARRLVEIHGGSIRAQSAGPGQGSVFTVRLPIAALEERPSAEREVQGRNGRTSRRVLLVEDSPDVAESFAMLLRTLGHEVRVAPDGAGALDAAREFRPDVVLLDIGLPDMDGYEVARCLRAEYAQTLRLVALTGYGQEEDRRRAREAGFDQHLLKPVKVEELERVVGAVGAG